MSGPLGTPLTSTLPRSVESRGPNALSGAPWLQDGWVPTVSLVEAPVLAETRAQHVRLVEEIDAAQVALRETTSREMPSGTDAFVWRFDEGPRGMASNPAVKAAVHRERAAERALCEWMTRLFASLGPLLSELHHLTATVARNDEARYPEVQRVGWFVHALMEGHNQNIKRGVDRLYRNAGGVVANGVGVAW